MDEIVVEKEFESVHSSLTIVVKILLFKYKNDDTQNIFILYENFASVQVDNNQLL